MSSGSDWFTVRWEDGQVVMIDQRVLPVREEYLRLADVEAVAKSIEDLAVRGGAGDRMYRGPGSGAGCRTQPRRFDRGAQQGC